MRYCPNCGDEIEPTDKYCLECGVELAQYGVGGDAQNTQQRRSQSRRQQSNPPAREKSQKRQSTESTSSRRGFLAGFGILSAVGVGILGWIGFQRINDGPEGPAKDFIRELGDGNFREANELLHSNATIDGAGVAGDVISSVVGVDAIFEVADVSVVGSRTLEEGNGRARVAVTINIDVGIDDTEGDVGLIMRKENGDWKVWDVSS